MVDNNSSSATKDQEKKEEKEEGGEGPQGASPNKVASENQNQRLAGDRCCHLSMDSSRVLLLHG